MPQYERQKNILDYLQSNHSATVKELAHAVYASEASVRRDIARLEASGHVERIYGSILLAGHENAVVPVGVREMSNISRKEIVAKMAAERIQDGDTVILDASTTTFRICRHILDRKHLNVVTNNLRVCEALGKAEGIQVYCTGGTYNGSSSCFLGANAEEFLQKVHADKLFFSAQGIDESGAITDVSEQEISMRKAMMRQSKQIIFLCDATKFGIRRPFTMCSREDVDEIICDIPLSFPQK